MQPLPSLVVAVLALVTQVVQASPGPGPNSNASPSPARASLPQQQEAVPSSVDGMRVSYRVAGVGSPALVLIHCWMCDSTIWDNVVPELSKQHRVVTLDLPGHGSAGKSRQQWSMAAFGADVKSVVDALKLEKVILVGHSMGGAVMLEAAAQMPTKVVGMIGVDTLHDPDQQRDAKEIDDLLAKLKTDFRGTAGELARSLAGKSCDPAAIGRVIDKMGSGDPAIGVVLMDRLRHYDG
jgi:pimeloyl-ACP methyl ester carboxylesterase